MTNYVFRPVRETDLEGLLELVNSVPDNLATVPKDKERLAEKIDASLRSFFPRINNPGAEHYFFVMEERNSGRILGVSGLFARVGGFDPFYTYEILTERLTHAPMGIDKSIQVLSLKTDHKGPSEIGSLLLHPECQGKGLGRLLSLSRFLFMGRFPQRFDPQVVAELRGFLDKEGSSPFWECVGRPFFEVDFYQADMQCGMGDKDFIHDLMPRNPLYVPLLTPQAREVIGKVHSRSLPAKKILEQEGFTGTNEIDIFDAGPLIRADIEDIRTIRERKTATISGLVSEWEEGSEWIISNRSLDFRSCFGTFKEEPDGSITLSEMLAFLLRVAPGDSIDYVRTRPV